MIIINTFFHPIFYTALYYYYIYTNIPQYTIFWNTKVSALCVGIYVYKSRSNGRRPIYKYMYAVVVAFIKANAFLYFVAIPIHPVVLKFLAWLFL